MSVYPSLYTGYNRYCNYYQWLFSNIFSVFDYRYDKFPFT